VGLSGHWISMLCVVIELADRESHYEMTTKRNRNEYEGIIRWKDKIGSEDKIRWDGKRVTTRHVTHCCEFFSFHSTHCWGGTI